MKGEQVSRLRMLVRRVRAWIRWRQMSEVERLNQTYDRDTVRIIESLPANANCVDVGASDGAILREMIRACPNGSHLAFEARPEAAARLAASYPMVCVHGVALADKVGEATFNVFDSNPGYSGLRTQTYPGIDARPREIRVPLETLDHVIPPNQSVAFIKIDVEGAELAVLKGAQALLQRQRPIVVFECGRAGRESYGLTPAMVYEFLRSCDLRVSLLSDWLRHRPALTLDRFEAESLRHFYFVAHG